MKLRLKKYNGLSISKSLIRWSILIHPFLKPNGIQGISSFIANIYDLAVVISFLLVLIIFLHSRVAVNANIVITASFIGWICAITVISGGQKFTILRMWLQYVGLAITVSILAEKPDVLIKSMLLNLEILVYANFICLVLYPHGMYVSQQSGNWNNWLLGYDNQWFIVFFGAMFVALTYRTQNKSSIRPLILIAVMHISTVIVMSGVLIFGLGVIDVLMLTRLYKGKFFTYKNVWLVAIIANIVIVFFSTSAIASFIIYDVFRKGDSSIPARLRFWEITFNAIKSNPLFGYGRPQTLLRTMMYHNNHGSNAHNFILEVLYEGGLIGICLFVSMAISTGLKISKARRTEMCEILLVCIMACLVTGSVDNLLESRGALFFWMLSIGYCMPQIDNSIRETL